MIQKISILFLLVFAIFSVNAQTSNVTVQTKSTGIDLFSQYDSAMNQYKSAKSNYDAKKDQYETVKNSAVDVSSLSISGATEKTKAIAIAKLEKEKAALDLNTKKKAVVEIADKGNKVYQEQLTASKTELSNAEKNLNAKATSANAAQTKFKKAKGKLKTSAEKELKLLKEEEKKAKDAFGEILSKNREIEESSKKAANNLKTANELATN
jgi:hypothetical protein